MTRPTMAQEREISEVESHEGTLSLMLVLLRIAMRNAQTTGNDALIKALHAEIEYTARQLEQARERRKRLRRLLGR
jgi:hypothetical protein